MSAALSAGHADVDRRSVPDGLVDDAVALGQLEELVEPLLRRVGVDREGQPDLRETDRRFLVDPERAAKIEIALGMDERPTATESRARSRPL